MVELLAGVIVLLILVFFGMVIYKYRYQIKRFCKDPKYGSSWQPSRETYLKRRIEDAESELEWLETPPRTD